MMVRAPTPAEEDRRRLCRERKVLTAERVRHVNRIKGLLFAQGVSEYEPPRRDRRERLAGLVTGDGRLLPNYLRLVANSIASNYFSSRSRPWRPSGIVCWLRQKRTYLPYRRCCSI
jgi:transposase